MKELDLVRLKGDYKEICKGTRGTVVLIYDEKIVKLSFLIKRDIP
ncbi:MAG: hypothetical protein PUI80_06865 [Peptoniphilaceae bacterium]|nr:hypothetical protein [Peptoniphilaceae bacterium]